VEILEPIILEPAGLTPEQGWAECCDYVAKCGGLTDASGELNLRAAFGADPGVCSCPKCHVSYWAWGTRLQCVRCGFTFPTDWWPMYSYGVSTATARARGAKVHIGNTPGLLALHERQLAHPYYRYGFEHPVESAWDAHDKIDWAAVLDPAASSGAER
jgi:hypothetical protein